MSGIICLRCGGYSHSMECSFCKEFVVKAKHIQPEEPTYNRDRFRDEINTMINKGKKK